MTVTILDDGVEWNHPDLSRCVIVIIIVIVIHCFHKSFVQSRQTFPNTILLPLLETIGSNSLAICNVMDLKTKRIRTFLLRNYREVASYDINSNDADPFPRLAEYVKWWWYGIRLSIIMEKPFILDG